MAMVQFGRRLTECWCSRRGVRRECDCASNGLKLFYCTSLSIEDQNGFDLLDRFSEQSAKLVLLVGLREMQKELNQLLANHCL